MMVNGVVYIVMIRVYRYGQTVQSMMVNGRRTRRMVLVNFGMLRVITLRVIRWMIRLMVMVYTFI